MSHPKFMILKVCNSKEKAIWKGKWSDPGARLYDQLMNSAWMGDKIPESGKELDKVIAKGEYKDTTDFIKEAYGIAPVHKIKNSPYGRTPFVASGCKYAHHKIVKIDSEGNQGELCLHVEGLKAAYKLAKKRGELKGELKKHLVAHLNELGLLQHHHGEVYLREDMEERIDRNFSDIESYISESLGIHLEGTSHAEQKDFPLKRLPPIYQELIKASNTLIIDEMKELIKKDKRFSRLNKKETIDELETTFRDSKWSGVLWLTKKPRSYLGKITINYASQHYEFYDTHRDEADPTETYEPIYKDYYAMMQQIEKNLKPMFDEHKGAGLVFLLRGDPIDQIHEFEFDLDEERAEELWEHLVNKKEIDLPSLAELKESTEYYNEISDELKSGLILGGLLLAYVGFVVWLSRAPKNLRNLQLLSHPQIMNGGLPYVIIGTPITIKSLKQKKEAVEDDAFKGELSLNESPQEMNLFTVQERMNNFGLNMKDVKAACESFSRRFGVTVAIDSGYIQGHIAFAMNAKSFKNNYAVAIDRGMIEIIAGDGQYELLICFTPKVLGGFSRISRERFELILAHEYGHVKTLPQFRDIDFLTSHTKIILLKAMRRHGNEEHYLRAYYATPSEKAANDYVGITSDASIAALANISSSSIRGWETSVFGKIIKLNIPDRIANMSRLRVGKLTEDDLKFAVEFSIKAYDEILPPELSSPIIQALKEVDPALLVIENRKGMGKRFFDIRTALKEGTEMEDDLDYMREQVGDGLDWIEKFIREQGEDPEASQQAPAPQKESMPKKTDKAESNKNGVNRKKLYIAFIEWAKAYNSKNSFGSVFDENAFKETYPFVPEEMRYFYRLANPMLCVLAGELTFFALAELRKLNMKNSRLSELMIFAATKENVRVFNKQDKKIYLGVEENGMLKTTDVLGETFDLYLQKMINQGEFLNAPLPEQVPSE